MSDTAQNYSNHRRYVIGYHYIAGTLAIVVLGWALNRVMKNPNTDTIMVLCLALSLTLIGWYARAFALAVQNRVIRLEEQMRLARLCPEIQARMAELTIPQYVALRFASDQELPALTALVLKDHITNADAIKKLIKDWRPDLVRA